MGKTTHSGFTLLETLVVICIVGVLSLVVFPTYINHRETSTASQLANSFRTYASSFSNYAVENGSLPEKLPMRIYPEGMEGKLPNFSEESMIGGYWDWNSHLDENRVEIRLVNPQAGVTLLERIDQMLDDGDLLTGSVIGNEDHLTMIIQR